MSYEETVTQAITSLIRATLQDPKAAWAIVEKVTPRKRATKTSTAKPSVKADSTTSKPTLSVSERQRRAAFKAWKTRRAAKKA